MRSIAIELSLSTTSICLRSSAALFMPSSARPLTIDASPTTATTLVSRPAAWSAQARPVAVEIALPAWPTAKRS